MARIVPHRLSCKATGAECAANMGKTLLAVSFAVLVSMMLAPHGGKRGIECWGPFFSENGVDVTSGGIWYGDAGRVMIDMLALEMVFLAVLFAVLLYNDPFFLLKVRQVNVLRETKTGHES